MLWISRELKVLKYKPDKSNADLLLDAYNYYLKIIIKLIWVLQNLAWVYLAWLNLYQNIYSLNGSGGGFEPPTPGL